NLDAGVGRWPSFSAAALQAGFASALALPLRLREVTLGALNLLSVTRAPMAEADVIVARAFADLATLSIAQHRASAEAQRLNEQLSAALTSRASRGRATTRPTVQALGRLPQTAPPGPHAATSRQDTITQNTLIWSLPRREHALWAPAPNEAGRRAHPRTQVSACA